MNLQTNVEIPATDLKISYQDSIMTMGSCFAENIGNKLSNAYFDTDSNPFGVLYNPVSIKNSLELLLQNKRFGMEDLFEYRSLWNSFAHSTLFSNPDSQTCLDSINSRLERSVHLLNEARVLVVTFGTAWVFEDRQSGSVVSNCHKLPADRFTRRRLTVEEIVTGYSSLISELADKLSKLKLIFSVSPIRHWKDGAHENNISKSTLLLAVEELQNRFDNIHYFPAYEIQMDELRDYRFYAADMLHPSEVAVDYIWQKFCETYFSESTLKLKKELEQLSADLAHRPLHPESEEYQQFKATIEKKKAVLIQKNPFLEGRL